MIKHKYASNTELARWGRYCARETLEARYFDAVVDYERDGEYWHDGVAKPDFGVFDGGRLRLVCDVKAKRRWTQAPGVHEPITGIDAKRVAEYRAYADSLGVGCKICFVQSSGHVANSYGDIDGLAGIYLADLSLFENGYIKTQSKGSPMRCVMVSQLEKLSPGVSFEYQRRHYYPRELMGDHSAPERGGQQGLPLGAPT